METNLGDVLKAPFKTGMAQEVRFSATSSAAKGAIRLRRMGRGMHSHSIEL